MTPLVLPLSALALSAGIALAAALPIDPALALAGATLLALAAAALRCRPLALALLLSLGTGLAGVGLGSAALYRPVPACHVSRYTSRQPVRLWGEVLRAPQHTSSGGRVLLEALQMERGGSLSALCGRIELFIRDAGEGPWPGEQVLARTKLRPAVPGRNPGVSGAGLRYLSDDIGARAGVGVQDFAMINPRPPPPLERVRQRIRALLSSAIKAPTARAIVSALVLGERQGVTQEMRERFALAGVSHLLAISGLHLSLVALGLLGAFRWLLLRVPPVARQTDPRRMAALLAAGVAVFYTVLTHGSPSTVRACVMVCACFAGLATSRIPDLVRPLSLACLVLLIKDPLNLLRPGFQLSFAAVIGIFLLARQLHRRGRRSQERGVRAVLAQRFRGLLLATLAATLFTAPLVAHHFGRVSLAGLLTNLLAVPWTSLLLLPLSLLGALAGLLWPALGLPLLEVAGWAAQQLDRLVLVASAADLGVMAFSPGWCTVWGCCSALLGIFTARKLRSALLMLALGLFGVAGLSALEPRLNPSLEMVFLDVGQGDSTFIRFPGGATMLVDGGGSVNGVYDPGATRVVPFLRAAGISWLDHVVATHPHPDHVAGLGAVLRAVEVGELWVCWHLDADPWLTKLLEQARDQGVKVVRPYELHTKMVRVQPLWPVGYEGQCADPGFSGNDNSIVLRLQFGESVALLPGDIEAAAEERMVRLHGARLRAHVLKAPHHGSGTSSTEELLRTVSPRLAIISCGLDNNFGIPPAQVLARYARLNIPLARVDLQGALGIRLFADGAMEWRPLTDPWPRLLPSPSPNSRAVEQDPGGKGGQWRSEDVR